MEQHIEYDKVKEQSGMSIVYDETKKGETKVAVTGARNSIAAAFAPERIDEAHILYMEAGEILKSRAGAGENADSIAAMLEKLFALYKK